MPRNEHLLHLPGPGRASISVRLRRHLCLLLSSRWDGGMKNEEESHVQKAPNANHFILVIWGRHDVMIHDFFICDWCHFVRPGDNSAPCCALWVWQFGKIFLSICSNPEKMSVFSTRNCVWHRHAVPTAEESPAGKRSKRIQPIGRFAMPMLKCLVEKTDCIRLFFDTCSWLLIVMGGDSFCFPKPWSNVAMRSFGWTPHTYKETEAMTSMEWQALAQGNEYVYWDREP